MSQTLHLGEVDVPYAGPNPTPKRLPKSRPGKQRPRRASGGSAVQTTGDVATILEAKYGLFSGFWDLHGQEIADACAEAMGDALDAAMAGHPLPAEPLAPAMETVGELYREFIDREELQAAGVPTQAALKGVSHRFKHAYAKGHPRRPSFVDTGAARAAFLAWVT